MWQASPMGLDAGFDQVCEWAHSGGQPRPALARSRPSYDKVAKKASLVFNCCLGRVVEGTKGSSVACLHPPASSCAQTCAPVCAMQQVHNWCPFQAWSRPPSGRVAKKACAQFAF